MLLIFLRRRLLETRGSRTTSNLTPAESPEPRRGESASTVGDARGDPLQCARGDSLQEKTGVADASEADRDAMEVRKDIWSMSGEFIYRHHV